MIKDACIDILVKVFVEIILFVLDDQIRFTVHLIVDMLQSVHK